MNKVEEVSCTRGNIEVNSLPQIHIKATKGVESILVEYGVCGDIRYGAVLGYCSICLAISYDCFLSVGEVGTD